MAATFTLDSLNSLSETAFVGAVGDIFEHAPWVAEGAAGRRPFPTVTALHDAMVAVVRESPAERQLAFIRAHPELGSKVKRLDWTTESQSEQGSLGLDRLSDAEFTKFSDLNKAYREKFGFPFIICVRRHTRDSILRQFERRLANDADAERKAALDEIALITRLRLVDKVDGPGKPKTTGRISTHVLDNVSGQPAQGVTISLYEVGASARSLLAKAVTNSDGRTDQPFVAGEPLRIGTYELQFEVAAYFAANKTVQADPAFLGIVPIRFSVAEAEGHYHVPLLVTPWSYSTYRGS
ncbi:2-oxo-4-hydroxy-4-carboxy-5-ureidoimidazoline decarboxylase [Pseudorhodoplanes sinuspersici]|uniref:OHCU decarboxylase n=1 Tax=Pseudorhodoplanes sinuspersici TaxID=1235591 RepID=A0A1W6ZVV2_9HYPH|nr:2-oxo-4-hydroxy-4-carboxy-5-ureidoimidazoline decarboxylase [Pseudorhodoplanes sinuspersici]ARQ00875.1 OHCU decarboxylase [Pseudorhodoplanes sinuspersici]RKE72497.1 2-oxo-4-hydroxy-4-carboxy-5-ureidoimidazoline decarboxylase [Pseudorhodoplanes sinuspersici]